MHPIPRQTLFKFVFGTITHAVTTAYLETTDQWLNEPCKQNKTHANQCRLALKLLVRLRLARGRFVLWCAKGNIGLYIELAITVVSDVVLG